MTRRTRNCWGKLSSTVESYRCGKHPFPYQQKLDFFLNTFLCLTSRTLCLFLHCCQGCKCDAQGLKKPLTDVNTLLEWFLEPVFVNELQQKKHGFKHYYLTWVLLIQYSTGTVVYIVWSMFQDNVTASPYRHLTTVFFIIDITLGWQI